MSGAQEEIRAGILAAAQGLFERYGFSKTTVDDIAHAVRMAKSSLYYYFQSKEEIYKAVLDKETDGLKQRVSQALAAAPTAEAALRTYTVLRMRAIKDMANVYSAFRDEYVRNYAFIQKIREGYDRYEVGLIRGILASGVENGEFEIVDLDLTSKTVFTAMKGLEYEWAVDMEPQDMERNIGMMLDILFHGIAKRSPA